MGRSRGAPVGREDGWWYGGGTLLDGLVGEGGAGYCGNVGLGGSLVGEEGNFGDEEGGWNVRTGELEC